MHDKDRADDDKLEARSMLANLMTSATAYAIQRGLSLEEIAQTVGLTPHDLVALPERVAEDPLSQILEMLQSRFPEEAVGLEMAAEASLNFLGPFEQAARLVPDLRTGLQMFVQFRSLLSTSFVLELIEDAPRPTLRFEHPNDRRYGPQGAQMALMMGARSIREVLGATGAICGASFAHGPTAPVARYEAAFGVELQFHAAHNALLFHADALDHPVDPTAGHRLRVVRAHLELVRRHIERQAEPVQLRRIRDAAARNAARGEFGAEALARQVGMSVRTLQRRITEFGCSVSSLVEEVREANARQMLSDPTLTLIEISQAAGYSTESAFRRAFRRWTGKSPAEYRRSLASSSVTP